MKLLSQHIESLIFTSEKPIKLKEIKSILEETFETKFKSTDLENAIGEIEKRYEGDNYAFEMIGIAEGYQFLTKGSYFNTVATFLKQTTRKRLSRAALETLSIIAYKQPVSRPELERIRGVSCDYAIHKLLEKEMVTILGRSESPGRPLLYGTSEKFMDYFGLKTLNDMPKPKDFSTPENSIGEAAPIEEDTPNPNAKPKLELPITDLDEVVDMIAAILPPGPKLEIPEPEEEEIPIPPAESKLELPISDLEEVVDMIAAVLPEEPIANSEETLEPELVDKLATKGEAVSEMPQASISEQTPQGNSIKEDIKIPVIPVAVQSEVNKDLENVVDVLAASLPQEKKTEEQIVSKKETVESQKTEDEKSVKTPTIAQLFAEATKPKPSKEISAKVENIVPPVSSQELKRKEEKSVETPPTIAQLFNEATKPKQSNEISTTVGNIIPPISQQEAKRTEGLREEIETNELDEVVDVITASVPIENIPSESIVLNELIRKSEDSSEEE